jgi:hypothetical protein
VAIRSWKYREGPVFAATDAVTVPLPLPVVGDVKVTSGDAVIVAVHEQLGFGVLTVNVTGPPAAGTLICVGSTVHGHWLP